MNTFNKYLVIIEPQLLRHLQGKIKELVDLAREQENSSEDVLIQKFCGSEHNKKYYQNIKYRALKILQALAIVSGENSSNEVKKKLDLCRKNFTIGQKFLGNGKRKEGLNLIRVAHRIAVEYDFTHMAAELSGVLYHHYVYYKKNKQKAAEHGAQLLKYSKAYGAEKQAEYQFYSLLPYISGTLETKQFKNAIDAIAPLSCSSTKFIVHQAMIWVLYYFSLDDYNMAAKTCQDTLETLTKRKGVYRSHLQFFNSKKGIAQIALGLYKEAKQDLSYAKQFAPSRSANDYLLEFYLTLNALHAGDYELAHQLHRKNKKCPFENIRIQFAIIEAYLCFLAYTNYLVLERNFRIGKYLNETIEVQSDKKGNNIAILIAELLIYLVKDRAKYIDRIETIKTYSYRYLRGRSTMRAKRFLKVLCILPRCNFKADAVNKLASEHIDFIHSTPLHFGDNAFLEIIPFHHLLKMIEEQIMRKAA